MPRVGRVQVRVRARLRVGKVKVRVRVRLRVGRVNVRVSMTDPSERGSRREGGACLRNCEGIG